MSAVDPAVETLGGAKALTGLTDLEFEASATRRFANGGVAALATYA
ncbi:MAG: hypothetical protein AAGF11_49460 [Myxococcota bacterium]